MTEVNAAGEREKTIRTRNRALFALLLALAVLVYAVAMVRIGG